MSEPRNPLTGTIQFSRKADAGQYQNGEFGIFMQFDVDPDDLDRTVQNARDAAAQVKALVFEQLAEYGVKFSVEEGGFVRETLERHLGQVTEVTTRGNGGGAPQGQGNGGGKPSWLPASCEKCNESLANAYDNRAKKAAGEYKATYPDFKCAARGCGKGYWEPKK